MTFDFTKREPVPPTGLAGRFVNIGEFIEADDLLSYTPHLAGRNDANWRKVSTGSIGLKFKVSCLMTFFRPSVPYEIDRMGYYLPPQKQNHSLPALISLVPKGLGGRFLEIGDKVKENDLINYGSWQRPEAAIKSPKWKKTISIGTTATENFLFYRPYQKYLVDDMGFYLQPSDDKTYIIDYTPEVKLVKKITHPAIAKDKFD